MRFCCLAVLVSVAIAAGSVTAGHTQTQRDPTAPAQQPQAGVLTVVGRALLGQGQDAPPVRRARVTLTPENGTFSPQITDTDTDGAFRFDRLPAGAYSLLVEKPGFLPLERSSARGTVQPVPITVGPDTPSSNVTVVMQRAAAIDGQLLNERGEPAPNIVVAAVRLAYGPYGRRPQVIRQATTDDLGRYRLHTLPSGDYYIEAAPDTLFGVTSPMPADRLGFARAYYPGTARIDEARIVSLTSGQELSNTDFRMTWVRWGSVAGKVVDSANRLPAAVGFRLQRVGAPPGEVRGLSPRGGEFLFPAVPPGEYWLLATARPAPSADLEYAATRVTVAGEEDKDLTLTTARGVAVGGQVDVEGATPLPANLQVTAIETHYEMPPTQPAPAPASPAPGAVAPDGTFAFPSLFGPRLFRIDNLPAPWALKSVLLDGVDVSDNPVDLQPSPRARTLRLVITSRTASVTGSLEAATGGPAPGRIVIFGTDPGQWGMRSRVVRTVEVGPDGHYALTGLLAGRYYIIGVEYLDADAWFDPEVLNQLQATATPISLTEGQRVTSLSLLRR